jgi:hypothetical protein
MSHDTFYIHRIIYDPKFWNAEEAFLCESKNLNGEFDTVFVNKDSGKIFENLKAKFNKIGDRVLYFPLPLRAEGYTVNETDCIPGPNYTKRAVEVEIVGDNEPQLFTN